MIVESKAVSSGLMEHVLVNEVSDFLDVVSLITIMGMKIVLKCTHVAAEYLFGTIMTVKTNFHLCVRCVTFSDRTLYSSKINVSC